MYRFGYFLSSSFFLLIFFFVLAVVGITVRTEGKEGMSLLGISIEIPWVYNRY